MARKEHMTHGAHKGPKMGKGGKGSMVKSPALGVGKGVGKGK